MSPVREASLCVHLLSTESGSVSLDLYELLVPLASIARQSSFRVIEWKVVIPDGPSGALLRCEVEKCGFTPIGPSEYSVQVESFFDTSDEPEVGPSSSVGRISDVKVNQDSSYESICSDCGEPFTLKAGEKLFFETNGK